MSQVEITRHLPHHQSMVWPTAGGLKTRKRLDAPQKPLLPPQAQSPIRALDTPALFTPRNSTTPSAAPTDTSTQSSIIESLQIPQLQHARIRAIHGDHQPIYIAPPPPHFSFPSPPSTLEKPRQLKAPALIRSVSAIELPSARTTELNSTTPQPPVPTTQPNGVTAPKRRGRKPKDPVAHAAKKEAKEKKRLEREAALAALQSTTKVTTSTQTVETIFHAEAVTTNTSTPAQKAEVSKSRPSSSGSAIGISSRPSSSGMGQQGSNTTLTSQSNTESKKRSAHTAFSQDITASWLAGTSEAPIDLESNWPISTPIGSPITSPQTGGLGIFLQAPPSTPIDELLSSSAQLGINPALLFHEDTVIPVNERVLAKAAHALKSPMEILDEYPLPHIPPTDSSSSNRSTTPEEQGKKLGLMDLTLARQNEVEDRPSPKKKPRPDLVFSTTKRGKAIVSLQKNQSTTTDVTEPTTPTRPSHEPEPDLRSLVLKRRQELLGDEVGTEVTRISVHRRLTARKTSVGLMSPLSPKSTARREEQGNILDDSDSDSSDSSDSEDEGEEEGQKKSQQISTPLATPTNPLVAGQMQKSFSAPGLFNPARITDAFLPSTPFEEEGENTDSYPGLVATRSEQTPSFDTDAGMRCKTCGMLFRKQSSLLLHERTCMVKQTPFIPYDFLRADHVEDGFSFGSTGRQLFSDDILMSCESPLVQKESSGHRRGLSGVVVVPMAMPFEEEETSVGNSVPTSVIEVEKMPVLDRPKGTTRCICGKGEKAVSGVMVQCGKCEYWLHTKCLKVKAKDLPDEWYCPFCLEN